MEEDDGGGVEQVAVARPVACIPADEVVVVGGDTDGTVGLAAVL